MTHEDFINREIRIWGIDFVAQKFDDGYEVVRVVDMDGTERFSWLIPSNAQNARKVPLDKAIRV